MIIRNDDVAADTTLREIRTFCEMCDRYGVTPMHAVTPIGKVRGVNCKWSNAEIRERTGTALFSENREVVEYLKGRKADQFAVHGLWHTHSPTDGELSAAHQLLYESLDSGKSNQWIKYFVPPFNEGEHKKAICVPAYGVYDDSYNELAVCGRDIPRLEELLEEGDPGADIVYLHSWRFEHGPFTWVQLDRCLNRLTQR